MVLRRGEHRTARAEAWHGQREAVLEAVAIPAVDAPTLAAGGPRSRPPGQPRRCDRCDGRDGRAHLGGRGRPLRWRAGEALAQRCERGGIRVASGEDGERRVAGRREAAAGDDVGRDRGQPGGPQPADEPRAPRDALPQVQLSEVRRRRLGLHHPLQRGRGGVDRHPAGAGVLAPDGGDVVHVRGDSHPPRRGGVLADELAELPLPGEQEQRVVHARRQAVGHRGVDGVRLEPIAGDDPDAGHLRSSRAAGCRGCRRAWRQ